MVSPCLPPPKKKWHIHTHTALVVHVNNNRTWFLKSGAKIQQSQKALSVFVTFRHFPSRFGSFCHFLSLFFCKWLYVSHLLVSTIQKQNRRHQLQYNDFMNNLWEYGVAVCYSPHANSIIQRTPAVYRHWLATKTTFQKVFLTTETTFTKVLFTTKQQKQTFTFVQLIFLCYLCSRNSTYISYGNSNSISHTVGHRIVWRKR